MRMNIGLFVRMIAVAMVLGSAAPSHAAEDNISPPTAFERLASLAGDWKREGKTGDIFQIQFELIANDSVLVERWLRRGKIRSLTLYHRDQTDVVATHYCPQGNQPRMKLRAADGSGLIAFDFWDATNLATTDDNHQHGLSFDLSDPKRIKRAAIYLSSAGEEPSELVLERMP